MSESAGQQSIERLCTGHPLALARLKELMQAEARYRVVRQLIAFEDIARLISDGNPHPDEAESVRTDFAVDEAIAEGGR